MINGILIHQQRDIYPREMKRRINQPSKDGTEPRRETPHWELKRHLLNRRTNKDQGLLPTTRPRGKSFPPVTGSRENTGPPAHAQQLVLQKRHVTEEWRAAPPQSAAPSGRAGSHGAVSSSTELLCGINSLNAEVTLLKISASGSRSPYVKSGQRTGWCMIKETPLSNQL
ncbi:Sodium leak channel non-selective protein [Manis javanica]|nr:Sodium leak channel non-selective protein [Manis javanica]